MQLTRQEAEDFLYQEASLLDERRLEDWLELFTADGKYWVPIDEDSDPEVEPSVLYDDAEMLARRVYQLRHQPHYSQRPPSRTIHAVSNVRLDGRLARKFGLAGEETAVYCTLIVYELRGGDQQQFGLGEQRSLAARCQYLLRFEGRWRIALKKVILINRDLPLENKKSYSFELRRHRQLYSAAEELHGE